VEVRAAAEQLGLETDHALQTLAREDLVHRGADGEITSRLPLFGPADRASSPLPGRT
jgi:hypothetical protein